MANAKFIVAAVFAIVFFQLFQIARSFADCLPEDVIKDHYIVRLKSPHLMQKAGILALHAATRAVANFKADLTSKHIRFEQVFSPQIHAMQILSVDAESVPAETIIVTAKNHRNVKYLRRHPAVSSVENDCRVHLFSENGQLNALSTPNDPYFPNQWALQKIQAPAAWDISTGSTNIIVGVSDTGVDYLHPDLQANIWINSKEIPNNGIDDDQNGCVDDYYGCDVTNNSGDPMPPQSEEFTHGTHVAGIIGAVGNNGIGISGVNQHVRLMPIKAFDSNGGGSASLGSLLRSIYYGVYMGARVINCSWGRQGQPQQAEIDAFKYALRQGVMVVVAAGNSHSDVSGFSPASLPWVISVAASDSADRLAMFSNFGSGVKLVAPGGYGYDGNNTMIDPIFSTLPRFAGSYGNMIGTSMAAPFVSGLAALILSVKPSLNPYEVYHYMRDGGDPITVNTVGGTFNYKRINAYNSLRLIK